MIFFFTKTSMKERPMYQRIPHAILKSYWQLTENGIRPRGYPRLSSVLEEAVSQIVPNAVHTSPRCYDMINHRTVPHTRHRTHLLLFSISHHQRTKSGQGPPCTSHPMAVVLFDTHSMPSCSSQLKMPSLHLHLQWHCFRYVRVHGHGTG